jgi:hypothetical protein
MFCKRYIINLEKKDDIIDIRPIGDVHLGNVSCDETELQKQLKYIETHDNCYTIGMGDYIDNVMAYAGGSVDKRWNPETVSRNTLTTQEQIDRWTDYWKPVAHKSVGMLAGNHEWKTIDQKSFIKEICNPVYMKSTVTTDADGKSYTEYKPVLDKNGNGMLKYSNDYLGRLAYVMISFKHNGDFVRNYLGLVMHGGYAGAFVGGALNRLKAISGDFDADFVLAGHSHDTGVTTHTRLGYDLKTNSIAKKKVVLGMTGTFLEGYEKGVDSYVEISPKSAKRIGTITLSMNAYEGKMYGHD